MDARLAQHPADPTLYAYGMGRLDRSSAEVVRHHVDSCPACRRRVAEVSRDELACRFRDAEIQPVSPAPAGPSATGYSSVVGDPHTSVSPAACALAPELADYPNYHVLRELGHGGMGVVYLAENTLMGRREALKVVSRELMERRNVSERFLREIRNSAQLQHPNIVTAYSAMRAGDRIVLAMEYIEGSDLGKLVHDRGPLQVADACNFIHQAALGLQHAHERGMVHRDIKPTNLMLARTGNRAVIKILDFGLARVTQEVPIDGGLTRQGQMLGTPDYVAPEQTLNARTADIRADIYSLGCTFYYLLTGAPPFPASSLYEILQAHQSVDAMPLNLVRPEVPMELAAVVAKMMAKEPSNRFQNPREVAQATKRFFKPTEASVPTSRSKAPRMTPSGTARGAVATPPAGMPIAAPASAPSAGEKSGTKRADLVAITDLSRDEGLSNEQGVTTARMTNGLRWLWPSSVACALVLGLGLIWMLGFGAQQNKRDVVASEPLVSSEPTNDKRAAVNQPRGEARPTREARAAPTAQQLLPDEVSAKAVPFARQPVTPPVPVEPEFPGPSSDRDVRIAARDGPIDTRKALLKQPVDVRQISVRRGVERLPNPRGGPLRGGIWPPLTATNFQAWQVSDPDRIELDDERLLVSSGPNGNLLLTRRDDYKTCSLKLTLAATEGTEAFLALRAHQGPDGRWRAITVPIIDQEGQIQARQPSLDFGLSAAGKDPHGFPPGKSFWILVEIDNANRARVSLTKGKLTPEYDHPPGSDYMGAAGVFVKSGTLIIYHMDVRE